jgi:hypothetical protein
MGFMQKVKGFLNIGGVKLKITKVENPFHLDDTVMQGNFMLTSKTDKTVLAASVEFYMEETKHEKEKKTTHRHTLGSYKSQNVLLSTDYPVELAAGESKEMSFIIIDVNTGGLTGRLADKGGLLGAVGTAAKFIGKAASHGEIKYFVEVSANVKGTPFGPSDKVQIQVMAGKS